MGSGGRCWLRYWTAEQPPVRAGTDVFGVDLSSGMIDVARRTHSHLRFEVGVMGNLRIQHGVLGCLLVWYSLIHTAPRRLTAVVSEFARVLL